MTDKPRNSVAAVMNVLVAIVMWMAIILGPLFVLAIGMAIAANMGGGSLDLGGLTIDDGVGELGQLVTALLGTLVVFPGIIYVCIQLRRILSTLAGGDPFVPENAGRLTKIAGAMLIMQLLRYVIAIGVGLLVDGAEVTIKFELITLASIAALFVLAQVFKEGTRLRDEEKMTI